MRTIKGTIDGVNIEMSVPEVAGHKNEGWRPAKKGELCLCGGRVMKASSNHCFSSWIVTKIEPEPKKLKFVQYKLEFSRFGDPVYFRNGRTKSSLYAPFQPGFQGFGLADGRVIQTPTACVDHAGFPVDPAMQMTAAAIEQGRVKIVRAVNVLFLEESV